MEWAGVVAASLSLSILTIYIIALTVQASSAGCLRNVEGAGSKRRYSRVVLCRAVLPARSVHASEAGKSFKEAIVLLIYVD